MRSLRRLLMLAAVMALAVTSIALAAKPGIWTDQKHSFYIGVQPSGKRIGSFSWSCTKKRYLTKTFTKTGPKVRKKGEFSWSGKASVIKGEQPSGTAKLTVNGRFVTRHGKQLAVGKVSAGGCKATKFKAKFSPQQG